MDTTERELVLKAEIRMLNKLQQRLNDWSSSVNEQIKLKDNELRSYDKKD